MAEMRTDTLNSTATGRGRPGVWLILIVSFALFLLVAMVGQLLGQNWRAWLPGAEGHNSLFASVKSAAYSVLPLLG